MTSSWRQAIDEKRYVGAGFLDLTKAFDCVDHSILLSTLPYYGIQEQELKWIRSYLDAQIQQVLVNGCLSDPGHLTTGVPQGSILGPLFFVIYTNDMPSVVRYCNVNMYADDTEIHCDDKELPNVEKYLQDDICNIGLWMTKVYSR